MLETLASAWTVAIWWAAVIFFVGLFLAVATAAVSLVVVAIGALIDIWAQRHVDKEK